MSTVVLGKYADTRFRCERDNEADLRGAVYVLGTQGSGKSTLLANLAEGFTAAGDGVLVVDTKGELAEDIASRTRHFPDRLVYVAPGLTDYPDGKRYWVLNPFEFDRSRDDLEELAVGNLLALFARMGLVTDQMTQVGLVLEMTARLALVLPKPSLPDLRRILYDEGLRARLLTHPRLNSDDDPVGDFWRAFERKTRSQKEEQIRSTVARINKLTTSAVMKRLLANPISTVRLADWLDGGKLVVANLGAKLSPTDSKALGNLVAAHLMGAAYRRPTVNQATVRIWRVIVDEFHELAGDQFAEQITQLRKYSVFPVLAHQNLSQLSGKLQNTVMSCPVRFFLRTTAEDRGLIHRLFGPETAQGLDRLPLFHARAHVPRGINDVETLVLPGWWAERDEGQLAAAWLATGNTACTLPAPPPASPPTTPGETEPAPAAEDEHVAEHQNGHLLDGWEIAEEPIPEDHPRSDPPDGLAAETYPAGHRDAVADRPAHLLDE